MKYEDFMVKITTTKPVPPLYYPAPNSNSIETPNGYIMQPWTIESLAAYCKASGAQIPPSHATGVFSAAVRAKMEEI
jgi:hypothetical protein